MKKASLTFYFLLMFLWIHAQEMDEYNNRLYSYSINSIVFFKYPENFQVKAVKNINDVKTAFPEQLVQSILSCSSEKWEIFNTFGGKDKARIRDTTYYSKVANMDVDKNYFVLKHKMEFTIDAVPTAIIKFYFITEGYPAPQAGITTLQKYNNRWYKVPMTMISNLSLTVLRLKTEELEKIISGSTATPELKDINKKVFDNGILDFNKLYQEMDSWYYDDSEINKAKLQYFKDANSIL